MSRVLASTILLTCLNSPPSLQAGEAIDVTSDSQMLVLTNGRVVTGQLTPRPDGYDVTLPAGRLFLPSNSVRFLATDLEDAYEKMRESLPQRTPDNHIALARWCLTNDLHAKARRELLDALHLDPYRGEAKRMLEALVRITEGSAAGAGDPLARDASALRTSADARPSRSLGGLSQPLVRDFVSRVQPLLTNKCGNAVCHGGDRERPFRIHPVRGNSSTYVAEQNLAAVLNQMNFQSPHSSELLKALDGLHGGSRVPLFRGRAGAMQAEQINDWVLAVAEEIAPPTESSSSQSIEQVRFEASQPSTVLRDVQPATMATGTTASARLSQPTGNEAPAADPPADQKYSPRRTVPNGRYQSVVETDQRFLREAEDANLFDAFDPDVFNRRFHPDRFESTIGSRKDSR